MIEESLRQFREAMNHLGIQPPADIKADGQLHRFCNSDKHRDQSAWYVFYADGIPGGSFGDWRLGLKQNWHLKLNRPFNDLEQTDYQKKIIQIQQVHEMVDTQRALEASKDAQRLWNQAKEPLPNHPYLRQKGIQAHGIREYKGQLVIPIQRGQTLQSLQWIQADGTKRFLKGGRVEGGYFRLLGSREEDIICVCEGYATGASLFEATGYAVVVAFHAGNLQSVAQSIREQYPHHRLIICADDDQSTPGNPGLSLAQEVAHLVGGFLAVPEFGAKRPPKASDFNDLHQVAGLKAICTLLDRVLQAPLVRAAKPSTSKRRYLTTSREMEPESQDWIWPEWLSVGDFHILAGTPGTGKSTIALNLAATISRGASWPDGGVCKPGHVLIWSSEDHHKKVLLPSLLALHHDRDRVHFINLEVESDNPREKPQFFDPARDLPKIEQEALACGDIRLIIIDPIIDAINADAHKNSDVRRALWSVMGLARHLNAAVLGISHFSKGLSGHAGYKPLEWVTGSMAFGAFARSVWLTVEETDFEGKVTDRLLIRAKSNLVGQSPCCGYKYSLESTQVLAHEPIITRSMLWKEPILGPAQQALIRATNQGFAEENSALEEAMDFLKGLLAGGAMAKKDIDVQAEQSGFSAITIRRAQKALGIQPLHKGYGTGSVWTWALPSKMIKAIKDAPGGEESTFKNEDEQLSDLARCHPEIVEGCKRSDILAHAEPEDYEDLKNPEVLKVFAGALKDAGKIKSCSPNGSDIGTIG